MCHDINHEIPDDHRPSGEKRGWETCMSIYLQWLKSRLSAWQSPNIFLKPQVRKTICLLSGPSQAVTQLVMLAALWGMR